MLSSVLRLALYSCRSFPEYFGTTQGIVIIPMWSLPLTVNRSCQGHSSLSLILWGPGQVTRSASDQRRVWRKRLCRVDSAAIVQAFGTVGLAHASVARVGPSPLPLAQARTAFGGGRQAFQVLRIAFLLCGLHLPSSPSLPRLALLLLESLSLRPQTSHCCRVASSHRRSRPGETIVLYLLGSASSKAASLRPTTDSLPPTSPGANLASRQFTSIHSGSSVQNLPPGPLQRLPLLSTRRDAHIVAATGPCERSSTGDSTFRDTASHQIETLPPPPTLEDGTQTRNKMFFLHNLTRHVTLHPSYFGRNMHELVTTKLLKDVEGTCAGNYFIITIMDTFDISEGRILPGSGLAEFTVGYRAVVWAPFRGETVG